MGEVGGWLSGGLGGPMQMLKLPVTIDGSKVLRYAVVVHRCRPTGKCRHVVGGKIPPPAIGLAICQYSNDCGYCLFYCDGEWRVVTDTYHESIEKAIEQAEFEYEGVSANWVAV